MTTTTHHQRPISGPLHGSVFLLFSLLLLVSTADAQTNGSGSTGTYSGFKTNFNPSMAIIIVVLIAAFFFMGFFSIYIRQCATERVDPGDGRLATGRSRRGARGLDQEVIETFPTLVYSDVKGLKIGKSALECAVCLSEFQDDETLRLLPKCSHVFHPDCIDAWLASKTTCPVCRCNLVPDPNAPPTAADAFAVADAAPVGLEEQVATAHPEHVAIDVDDRVESDAQKVVEPVNLNRIGSKNRVPWRSRSTARPAKFPRSHSTGHSSVVRPGENVERFTLRLPEHVRKEIMAGRLQRSTSCAVYPDAAGEGSLRRGYRGGGGAGGDGSSYGGGAIGGRSFKMGKWEWAAMSDRWAFLSRTFSIRVSKGEAREGEGSTRRGEGSTNTIKRDGEGLEGSTRGRVFPSVRGSLECLGGGSKADGAADDDEKSTTALAPNKGLN